MTEQKNMYGSIKLSLHKLQNYTLWISFTKKKEHSMVNVKTA